MINLPIDIKQFSASFDVYIVGGSVRNYLLNQPILDYDIVVSGNADVYADKLASHLHGRVIKIGKSHQGFIRIVTTNMILDVLPINGQSIEEDLSKRDFTINAIAYHLSSGKMIDVCGGMKDLKNKKIRMVTREAFRNDPVRLLRAYRMAAFFGFEITEDTASMIVKDAWRIRNSAGERIREELIRILKTSRSHLHICQMARNGLLFELAPEFKALKACTQNENHTHDVLEHTLSAFGFLEQGFYSLDRDFTEWSHQITQPNWEEKTALLKWAMLLHDIGKPTVQTKDRNGRIHFYGHSQKGAEIAQKINDGLRFSKIQNRYIDTIIRHHTRPLSLYISNENQSLTQKGLMRFFIKGGDFTPDILLHSLADMKGKGNEKRNLPFLHFINDTLIIFYRDYLPKTLTPPWITGYDLIHEFGLSPSPLFKRILNKIEEAKLSGMIQSKAEALKYTKNIINTQKLVIPPLDTDASY